MAGRAQRFSAVGLSPSREQPDDSERVEPRYDSRHTQARAIAQIPDVRLDWCPGLKGFQLTAGTKPANIPG
jgi:hypothetical protein